MLPSPALSSVGWVSKAPASDVLSQVVDSENNCNWRLLLLSLIENWERCYRWKLETGSWTGRSLGFALIPWHRICWLLRACAGFLQHHLVKSKSEERWMYSGHGWVKTIQAWIRIRNDSWQLHPLSEKHWKLSHRPWDKVLLCAMWQFRAAAGSKWHLKH